MIERVGKIKIKKVETYQTPLVFTVLRHLLSTRVKTE